MQNPHRRGNEPTGQGSEWWIALPWKTPPLNLNQRGHWATKARDTKDTRRATAWLVRAARIPPLPRVEVQLGFTPPDRRRRDTDNLVATLKAVADGVVDAGVVPDDTPQWMTKPEPIIDPPDWGEAGLWLRLTALEPTDPPPAPPRRRAAKKPPGLPPGVYPYNPRKGTR